MDNILSDIEYSLNNFSPFSLAKRISQKAKERRLELNITQEEMARKSGVSLGSIKRFESKSEISLKHLLMMAVALNSTENFTLLFSQKQYQNLDELSKATKLKLRKRARPND